MTNRDKQISIFVPNGDPLGIKEARIEGATGTATLIPRSHLRDYLKTEDAKKAGIYILFGDPSDLTENDRPKAYIGQSASSLKSRLVLHEANKKFWATAITFSSDYLNPTLVRLLEKQAIQTAEKTFRYDLDNKQDPSELDDKHSKAASSTYFETFKFLVSVLGFKIFQPLDPKSVVKSSEAITLYCNRAKVRATARYLPGEEFWILKGSVGNLETSPNIKSQTLRASREKFIESDAVEIQDDLITLKRDCAFRSPSHALEMLIGNTGNAWITWKDDKNHTMRELIQADKERE